VGVCSSSSVPPPDLRFGHVVVWVPDQNLLDVSSLQAAERPDQVLRSLEDFVPEEWGLPPFDSGTVPVGEQSGAEA
jgi:hypothetical protein